MKVSIISTLYRGNIYVNNLLNMATINQNNLDKNNMDIKIESILINDCPEEKIEYALDDYKGIEIVLINNKKNSGIHQSRINGLNVASGDYVLFLDQDDLIDDIFFVNIFKKSPEFEVMVTNAIIEQKNGKEIFYRNKYAIACTTRLRPYLYINNQIFSPGQCLIKKSIIPQEWKNIVIQQNGADDFFLWILLFCNNRNFEYNFNVLYTHSFTGENLSYDLDKMCASTLEMAKLLRTVSYVPEKVISEIERCALYKNKFRKVGVAGKLWLSLKNPLMLVENIIYHIRSRYNGGENICK